MKTIYKSIGYGNDDQDSYIIGLFEKQEDAEQMCKGKGVMGCGNGIVEKLKLFESIKEYEDIVIKRRALKKLSKEEKAILGL